MCHGAFDLSLKMRIKQNKPKNSIDFSLIKNGFGHSKKNERKQKTGNQRCFRALCQSFVDAVLCHQLPQEILLFVDPFCKKAAHSQLVQRTLKVPLIKKKTIRMKRQHLFLTE